MASSSSSSSSTAFSFGTKYHRKSLLTVAILILSVGNACFSFRHAIFWEVIVAPPMALMLDQEPPLPSSLSSLSSSSQSLPPPQQEPDPSTLRVLEEDHNHSNPSRRRSVRKNEEEHHGVPLPPPPEHAPPGTLFVPTNTTNTTSTTRTRTRNNTIALHCLLDDSNTFCHVHFSHALQALSQCWSYFQSQTDAIRQHQQQHSHPDDHDDDTLPRSTTTIHTHRIRGSFKSVESDWRSALVQLIMTNATYVNDRRHESFPRELVVQGATDGRRRRRLDNPNPNHDETRVFRPTAEMAGMDGAITFFGTIPTFKPCTTICSLI